MRVHATTSHSNFYFHRMQQARCTRTNERHLSVYWWRNHGASVRPSSIRCTSDVRNNGNECGGDGSASHLRSLLCLRPYCNGRHKTHFTRQLNSFSLHALRFHCWIAPPDTFSLPIICFCRAVHRSILFSLSHFAKCRKNSKKRNTFYCEENQRLFLHFMENWCLNFFFS